VFSFIHGYMDGYWEGLIRHGMIDNTSGIKLHQHIDVPEDKCFNVYAAPGTPLYETVRECSRPFYVDRLQGGWWYKKYDYDTELIRRYYDLCGDFMLGFQLHEWASNMSSDWQRITNGMKDGDIEYKAEAISRAATLPSHRTGVKRIWLESAGADEYEKLRKPVNREESIKQYKELLSKRQRETLNSVLPADSYYQAPRWEIEAGVHALMPEIGAQIPQERLQIALTRGMASAAGIKWGTYYEPWGGSPFGCCYYKRDMVCEWYLTDRRSDLFGGFYPDSGSSRMLQKRIYMHSLMSGAQFLSEEYGTCNTFYDWQDYDLTPYGLAKKNFLGFASAHPEIGDVYTPAVIVLPAEFEVFDINFISEGQHYLGYSVANAGMFHRLNHMRAILMAIFQDSGTSYGNESHVIQNSRYGDIFDIVYEDAGEKVLSKYDIIVNASPDDRLAHQYSALSERIITCPDSESVIHMLDARLSNLLPFEIYGNLSWILNRSSSRWILGLFNNQGVVRTREEGEITLREADTTAVIRGVSALTVLDGEERAVHRCGDGEWRYELQAGRYAVIEIK